MRSGGGAAEATRVAPRFLSRSRPLTLGRRTLAHRRCRQESVSLRHGLLMQPGALAFAIAIPASHRFAAALRSGAFTPETIHHDCFSEIDRLSGR